MGEEPEVVQLARGVSGAESPAALAAKRIMDMRKGAPVAKAPDAKKHHRGGPGQGARRCGKCGGDWEPRGRPGYRGYARICTGCDREVALCDCPPDPYRTGKNKHLQDARAANQRAKRSKGNAAIVHVEEKAIAPELSEPGALSGVPAAGLMQMIQEGHRLM